MTAVVVCSSVLKQNKLVQQFFSSSVLTSVNVPELDALTGTFGRGTNAVDVIRSFLSLLERSAPIEAERKSWGLKDSVVGGEELRC